MSEYEDPFGKNPSKYVAEVLQHMKDLGAVRLEAYYAGGNDEGGVENIDVLTAEDGSKIEAPPQWVETGEVYPEGHWSAGKPMTQYDPTGFWQALDNVLSTKYGSWAGDFSAYGTLYVDVNEGRAWTQGSESMYVESDSIEVTF